MKKYMYVELPEGVCCNIVTANKHIGISILRANYYVPRPSTVRLKLNVQPNNRFIMEYSMSKRSGGGVVDNTLDYQSRGRKIDPPLLRSFG